jgi:cytochrome c556
MVRTFGRWTVGVAACAFGLLLTAGAIIAEPRADVTSIEDIMKKGHAGKKSLLNQIKAGAKEEKWDDIAKPAKDLKKFGEELGMNKPEKGDDISWKKLTQEYATNTTAIADGVEKKDQKATTEALGKMGKSCKACHDSHKE